MKKSLLLLRHGEIGLRYRRRFIGRLDVPLNFQGRLQAASLSQWVRSRKPERCFCSPLKRCMETAQAALDSSALEVEPDPGLQEIDFGRWEKMTFEEIHKTDPGAVDQWAEFNPGFSFPEGESIKSFLSRIQTAAKKISSCPETSLLVVAHGGVIRALICHFLNLDPRNYLLFDIQPGTAATLALFGEKGVLTGLGLGGCALNAGKF